MVTVTIPPVNGLPARGYVRFVPTTMWGEPDIADLPTPITAKITAGAASAELEPNGLDWAWEVTYQIYGLPHWIEYYTIPASGTFNLADLTEVDPQTLDPAVDEPDPSWYTYVDQIVSGQVGRVVVVTGAEERPPFGSVFWVGGTIQPVNMAESADIWFKATS